MAVIKEIYHKGVRKFCIQPINIYGNTISFAKCWYSLERDGADKKAGDGYAAMALSIPIYIIVLIGQLRRRLCIRE